MWRCLQLIGWALSGVREPDVREEFIQRRGLIPVDSAAPDELRTFVEAEIARLGDIVRKAV